MSLEIIDTRRKALTINLDSNIYGTFAEIGAGQEVARNFFNAGAASGTVAKTMSAYDMTFSNEIYGHEESGRYVSRSRLRRMLEYEFGLLKERLSGDKHSTKTFFSFANTVTTINYNRNNDPHGWIGVKFELEPQGPEHIIIFHVRLLDSDATIQQNVLGILGVNLVYAAFYLNHNPKAMIESLVDNLNKGSVEIDLITLKGPAFEKADDFLTNLYLIQKGFSPATIFTPDGGVAQAKDLLYKKDIMILRTRFNQKSLPDFGLFQHAVDQYQQCLDEDNCKIVTLVELTLNNMMQKAEESDDDLLIRVSKRARELTQHGQSVIISNFNRHNKLAKYLSLVKPASVGITTSIANLKYIFLADKFTENYTNELLAYISDLFRKNVKLLVYPYRNAKTKEIITSKNLEVSPEAKPLYDFLLQNNYIVDIEGVSWPD